uniref:Major facilitator superfamily (MFS) profile domain-containing protein n=1 Tax=Leersia perrieri TaxID=77586 RepID=A0A0D9XNT3_9ORYZ
MAAGDEVAAAASPLLEMAYHEGCPGCAVDRAKALNPGVPYLRFFHIWIIILVSCLPISSLFPFLYFMIRDLQIAKRVEDIGFYAGFVGASYMLGRALTSTAWGMAADRIGRKPVIIFGIFSAFVFNTLFGLSTHYWMAITTRFLIGSLNGLLGPIRAYAIEVCRQEHQAIGLSLVSTSWAIGLIIGPAIGGYLAQPTEKYPSLFTASSLFGRFPYFLPCLCISVFCFIVLISCIWLPETLHKHAIERKGDCETESLNIRLVDSEVVDEQDIDSTTHKSLFKNWPLMSSIILFCIVSFDDMAYTEIFSLWSESDKKFGGLNFSSEDVGQVLAITGASILLYQTFIYPHIVKVIGIINTSRVAIILSMALLISYPPMTYLSRPWLSIVVNIASVLKNNFVPQHQRATANGLATTLMSFFKAFAPAGAGIVFSWAQKRQHDLFLPGDQMGCRREVVESAAAAPLLKKKGITTGDGYCIEGCPGCAVDRQKAANSGIPYVNFLFVWIVTLCTGRRRQAAAPLLEKKGTTGAGDGYNCIEGCPGCAVDRRKAANSGIPYGSFLFVWIVTLCTGTRITHESSTDSGAETPLLKGEGEFHPGCPGCVHDRKKGLYRGLPYKEFLYLWMICLTAATRFLLGALNGLLGPIKAYAIEVCRPEHEALALSLVSTAWGIGLIIGPAIGGYLSQPADKFPNVFSPDSLFARFPYVLPCICISVFAAVVLVGCIWMPYWMAVTTRFLLGALNGLLAPIKAYSIEVCRDEHQALGLSIVSTAWGIGLVVGPVIGGFLAQPVKQYPHHFHEKSIFWEETLHKHKGLETGVETAEASTTQESAESHKKSLFKNWPLMSSILTYCVFSLHDTAYSEIFSLWTVSDRKYGGLSFSSKDVGQVLAVAGASLLVYQLFIYRWVDKILGPINSTRIASALSIPIIAAYPFMTHLSGIRLGVALYTAAMIKSVLAAVAPAGADSLGHKRDNMQHSFQLMGEEAPPSPPAMRPVFHDGCHGCAMERKLESSHGIPYKEFIFVGITTIASSLPISSLFPFLYFMIEDLHVAKKEQDIGLYAGFLDRIGRKPIIKFSILSVVIFNTLFGLSVRYWMAIATRFLLGALNGMLAPIKVSTGWGIGLVLGPAIGGYFAQPAKQYPNMFSEKSIFGRFPYFLPCLCISLIALVVLISCIWLPETLHKHKNIEGENEMIDNSRSTMEYSHKQKSLYKNWPLMSSIIAYCVFTLHDTAYSEIFSLWAVSDKRYGGLSFSSKEVGQVLAVAGAGLLVYQLFIYRSVHKWLGPINSSRVASALSIPILAAYPFMPHLAGFRLGIALYLGTILKGVLSMTIITGTSLLQNNAVSQSQRGAANGISTTAMSFFKAIAPAGAGALFSWAQKRQNAAFFPGDQMIFFILNVIELVGLVLTFKPFLAIPK